MSLTLPTPDKSRPDQSHFPVISNEQITEINESAVSKYTKQMTQTWMTDGGNGVQHEVLMKTLSLSAHKLWTRF